MVVGAPGKGGWVDCNTCRKDKKTGKKKCSPCGRSGGEEIEIPFVQTNPRRMWQKGKWVRIEKGERMKLTESYVRQVIREEYEALVEEKKSAKDDEVITPTCIRKGMPGPQVCCQGL